MESGWPVSLGRGGWGGMSRYQRVGWERELQRVPLSRTVLPRWWYSPHSSASSASSVSSFAELEAGSSASSSSSSAAVFSSSSSASSASSFAELGRHRAEVRRSTPQVPASQIQTVGNASEQNATRPTRSARPTVSANSLPEVFGLFNWMAGVADDAVLAQLTIPGTHKSACRFSGDLPDFRGALEEVTDSVEGIGRLGSMREIRAEEKEGSRESAAPAASANDTPASANEDIDGAIAAAPESLPNAGLRNLLQLNRGVGTKSWAKTQDLTVYDQLVRGVRWLELSVGRTLEHPSWRIFNQAWDQGATVESIIKEVEEFLTNHPSETVMMNFHPENNPAVPPANYNATSPNATTPVPADFRTFFQVGWPRIMLNLYSEEVLNMYCRTPVGAAWAAVSIRSNEAM